MTAGIDVDEANGLVDAFVSTAGYVGPVAYWVRLHIGDPGAAGLANVAAETDRQLASFAFSALGLAVSDTDLIWPSVVSTETYAYVSFWSDATAGAFLGSAELTDHRSVVGGDDFIIPAGALTVQLIPLAA